MVRSERQIQGQLPIHQEISPPRVFTKLSPAKATSVYETFWKFAAERQQIYMNRILGATIPWTDDPILQNYKFTNVFRASDRVSQYLIKKVIYEGDQSTEELFFRIILFKFFNRIDTWELLKSELGTPTWTEFDFNRYDKVLGSAKKSGRRIYSAAYIMPSGGANSKYRFKHSMHLRLLEKMILENLPDRVANAKSMGRAFELIRSYPTIGDFLAYQYVTDINYSSLTDFSEMEFTVAGPGARDGISKCFSDLGGLTEHEVIKMVTDNQDAHTGDLGLPNQGLWGRSLQLIDVQNIFCEVSKYARVAHPDVVGMSGRTRIKQRFCPANGHVEAWFPPKWRINENIDNWRRTNTRDVRPL